MYKERRDRLFESLPDYSITVIMAGKEQYSVGDEKYPFEVNRSFYYYTGLDDEGLVLMFIKMGSYHQETLFIVPFDEYKAKWVGGRIKADRASEISGITDISYVDEILDTIGEHFRLFNKGQKFTLCGELNRQEMGQRNDTVDLFNHIKEMQPDVEVKNIYENIALMRMCKDESEIANMYKAIEVTKLGIETVMSYSHENIWENELEAYFDYTLKCNQCGHAFDSIFAAGKNATILHYRANNQFARNNELILCDLGARYKYYNADVTRTFPANGKFTDRQKQIYDIVLRANKYIASIARSGVTTRELNNKLLEFYQKELKEIGLLENGKTVRDYYWHGVSHTIGLETHDMNLPDRPLCAGSIISDEPGLYLEEEGIGIRIEDDLLIKDDGCEVLTKDIIKEISDIEAFMEKK